MAHISKIEQLGEDLPTKDNIRDAFGEAFIDIVHGVLREKLHDLRKNGMRGCLTSHLYEIMPCTEDQRKLLPSIKIRLSDGTVYTLALQVRNYTKPRQVKEGISQDLRKIEG